MNYGTTADTVFQEFGRLPSVRREGAADDFNGRSSSPGRQNAHDIESDRPVVAPVRGEIIPRHHDDTPLLPPCHRFSRAAAPGITTRLHFNEHHGVAVGGNNVNFSNSGAIAPGNNCVPLPNQRRTREVFAQFSKPDCPDGAHADNRLQAPDRLPAPPPTGALCAIAARIVTSGRPSRRAAESWLASGCHPRAATASREPGFRRRDENVGRSGAPGPTEDVSGIPDIMSVCLTPATLVVAVPPQPRPPGLAWSH